MHVRCEEDGCREFATHGYPGGRRVRCGAHKLAHMVRALLTGALACMVVVQSGSRPRSAGKNEQASVCRISAACLCAGASRFRLLILFSAACMCDVCAICATGMLRCCLLCSHGAQHASQKLCCAVTSGGASGMACSFALCAGHAGGAPNAARGAGHACSCSCGCPADALARLPACGARGHACRRHAKEGVQRVSQSPHAQVCDACGARRFGVGSPSCPFSR